MLIIKVFMVLAIIVCILLSMYKYFVFFESVCSLSKEINATALSDLGFLNEFKGSSGFMLASNSLFSLSLSKENFSGIGNEKIDRILMSCRSNYKSSIRYMVLGICLFILAVILIKIVSGEFHFKLAGAN